MMTLRTSLVKRYVPCIEMGCKYETYDLILFNQQDVLRVPWHPTWIQQYVFLLVYEQNT